jgi:hypothetical protein
MEERGTDLFELMPLITGKNALEAWQTGDVDVGMMTVGQSIGLIHDEPTIAELLERMVSEARERLAWAQYALNSPSHHHRWKCNTQYGYKRKSGIRYHR